MRRVGLISDPGQPVYRDPLHEAVGLGETVMQLGTGAVATPVAGLAGILAGVTPGGPPAADVVRNVQERLTYQPRGEVGQRTSEAISKPFAWLDEKARDIAYEAGEPTDVLGATAAYTAMAGLPALMGLRRGASPKLSSREAVFQRGRQQGYVAPPSSVSGRAAVEALEGAGGKLKTQQMASVRNQSVTNRLAAQALRLPEGTEITPAVLSQVRQSTHPVYNAVRGLGSVRLGNKHLTAIERSVREFRSTQQQLPTLGNKAILDIADELKQPALDSATMVDAIRVLRDKASAAYSSGEKGLGKAYRGMADALETAIDDHLAAVGSSPALLGEFRNARQLIAKSYTVENALAGDGFVNAQVLARQLEKGKPLTGELRQAAEFASAFPKATRVMKESVPNYSPLDAAYQLGSAAAALGTGNLAFAVPALYSVGRPFIRNYLLSGRGQATALPRPPVNALSPAATGSIDAVLPPLLEEGAGR